MLTERMARRSFLRINLAAVAAGGLLLVGCGEGEKKQVVTPQDDPSQKAKESMDYFKNNNLKKSAKPK